MTSSSLSLLTAFQAFLQQQIVSNMLFVPLCLIALDVATGVLSAIKTKTFDWKRIADFLGKDFFHYVVVVVLVAIAFVCVGQRLATNIAAVTGMTALSASLLASAYQNVKEISASAAEVLSEVAPLVGLPQTFATPAPALPPAVPVTPALAVTAPAIATTAPVTSDGLQVPFPPVTSSPSSSTSTPTQGE